ncbi:cytochrome P450 monooxygenase pc-3 [Irpex rosettiformis]|uniref:Cytochrome P450 monooxygenase pc-3 n=1 Tax=Irpex rosettiformis TaxID=378272 RepID=A0ACB8U6G8_9APHY|nr:cytochrome P450 monooxygenase pc-3 [Irpex rosettiformis]
MPLPPGIVYLTPRLPALLVPPVSVLLAGRLLSRRFGVNVPTALRLVLAVLSWPLALALHTFWSKWNNKRKAANSGAIMPPKVEYKLPGGLDLVKQYVRDREDRFLCYRMMEQMEQYGYTINSSVMFQDRIFTAEPEYVKRLLATDFEGFEKGPGFVAQLKSLLGTGVFNSDGEFHRGISRPFFSKDRISHFDVFDRHATKVLDLVKERSQAGYALDWQDLVARFTLDSATEFLFGKDLCSLDAGLPYPSTSGVPRAYSSTDHPANRFANSFLQAQELTAKRSLFANAWPLWEFWKSKVDEHISTMDEFIEPLLKEAIAKKHQAKAKVKEDEEEADGKVEESGTLLGHLVNSTDDPKIIRDETLNILLAGRDTTAITLTMSIYNLSQHPHILRRLREEIHEYVGTNRPSYDDIKKMKYLRAFINEVLRLYPPVPVNSRCSKHDTVWPSVQRGGTPLFIPADTRMVYFVFIMHRRKDLWGPTAQEFDPDRFLDDRLHKYLTPNPFIFLPFNAGPRICLGQQFAYNEISFMLIRLLQQITSIKLVQEANPEAVPPPGWAESRFSNGLDKARIKGHLTMYVVGGLWVEVKTVEGEGEEVKV